MRLWLLRPVSGSALWSPWYDKAFGFVVRAEDEASARALANSEAGDESGGWRKNGDAWTNPLHSTCEPLTDEGPEGVVMRDFASA